MIIAVEENMESLTNEGIPGRYLNPRRSAGWKQEWIDIFNLNHPSGHQSVTVYANYQTFIDDFVGTEDSYDRRDWLHAFRLSGNEQLDAVSSCLRMILELNALGRTPKNAYDRAIKHMHALYNRVADHDYANFNAFKWDYLNPKWNHFYLIRGATKEGDIYFAHQGVA